jgi:hypothetical protein
MAALIFPAAFLPLAGAARAENLPDKPAEALYLQLGKIGLDPAMVYKDRLHPGHHGANHGRIF